MSAPSLLHREVTASSTTIELRGLSANVLTWDPPIGAPAEDDTILLVHGWADAAASFDLVAPNLARAGFRVVAPDLRGFGDSAPAGPGGLYYFADYIADMTELLDLVAPPSLSIVGHSLGGTIAATLAGIHNDRVRRLVLLEGLGPPAVALDVMPDRYRKWLDELRAHAARPRHRSFGSMAEVVERLRVNHPDVPVSVLATRAPLLTRQNDDGGLTWKYDLLHRTLSPVPFLIEAFHALLGQIACPTLYVSGGPRGFHPDDEEARLLAISDLTRVELADAGHMMHWTAPDAVSDTLIGFLKSEK